MKTWVALVVIIIIFFILNLIGAAIYSNIAENRSFSEAFYICTQLTLTIGSDDVEAYRDTGSRWFLLVYSVISVTLYLSAIMLGFHLLKSTL
jgi:hypothetical protein